MEISRVKCSVSKAIHKLRITTHDLRFTIHRFPTHGASADYSDLIAQAHQLARPIKPGDDCIAGTVGSVIISRSGRTYTGIYLDFGSSLGFCAEHAAIAEMLKAHESEDCAGRRRRRTWRRPPTLRPLSRNDVATEPGEQRRPRHSRA